MIRLITGGARSGKSTFAESFYEGLSNVVYIATSRVNDSEMENRVKRHRDSRPDIWRTYEGNYNLFEAVSKEEYYILDCVTVLTSNILYDMTKDSDIITPDLERAVEDRVFGELEKLIELVKERGYTLNLVTNELGSGTVPDYHITRVFRDIQGRVNQKLAGICDEVHLVVCGIAVKIK